MRPVGPSTKVGVLEDSGRFFGAIALASAPMSWKPFGTPGLIEKSSIWLLSRMPVPGTMRPEPKKKLSVMVAATRLPLASSTEKCVVDGPGLGASTPGNIALGVARSMRIEARWPAA